MFACGCLVGALGWATQWAHFNSYIPAMTLGAIAAGCAVAAGAEAAGELFGAARVPVGVALAAALAAQLATQHWSPKKLIPTAADRQAGDRLVERLRVIDGEVLMPYHPWYAVLAGKQPFVHRMGILDVTYASPPSANKRSLPAQARHVKGLGEAISARRFAAIVLDKDAAQTFELPGLGEAYQLGARLSPGESPRSFSGAPTAPRVLLVPRQSRVSR